MLLLTAECVAISRADSLTVAVFSSLLIRVYLIMNRILLAFKSYIQEAILQLRAAPKKEARNAVQHSKRAFSLQSKFGQLKGTRYAVYFDINLPFQVYLPPDKDFYVDVINADNNEIISRIVVSFSEYVDKIRIRNYSHKVYKSKAHLTYLHQHDFYPNFDDEAYLNQVFDYAIEHMNDTISSLAAINKDPTISRVNITMLEPFTLIFLVDSCDWKPKETVAFLVNHHRYPVRKELISDSEVLEEMDKMARLLKSGENPFMAVDKLNNSAGWHLHQGHYREAVIIAQTALEVFIIKLLTSLLEEEGESKKQITNILNGGFINIIQHQFKKRIGGAWNINKGGGYCRRWYIHTYSLRNHIVHNGGEIGKPEAEIATHTVDDFYKYISRLVKKQKKKYPNTNKFFS